MGCHLVKLLVIVCIPSLLTQSSKASYFHTGPNFAWPRIIPGGRLAWTIWNLSRGSGLASLVNHWSTTPQRNLWYTKRYVVGLLMLFLIPCCPFLMALWGCTVTFQGCIITFWGSTVLFQGQTISFQGHIVPFQGCIISFQGCTIPFWGHIVTFWGCAIAFWACAISFQGHVVTFQECAGMFWGCTVSIWGHAVQVHIAFMPSLSEGLLSLFLNPPWLCHGQWQCYAQTLHIVNTRLEYLQVSI